MKQLTKSDCHLARFFRPLGLQMIGLCCWVALGYCSTPLSAADKVYPRGAVPASGKIVKLSPVSVTIEVRGKNQDYSLGDDEKIAFDEEPGEVTRARDNLLNGQVDQALMEIKKVDPASVDNPVIRQEVEFYRWYSEGKLALAGSGDKNAAIKGLLAIGSANRNTHHLFDLSEMLGELALAVGQVDKGKILLITAAQGDTQCCHGSGMMFDVANQSLKELMSMGLELNFKRGILLVIKIHVRAHDSYHH